MTINHAARVFYGFVLPTAIPGQSDVFTHDNLPFSDILFRNLMALVRSKHENPISFINERLHITEPGELVFLSMPEKFLIFGTYLASVDIHYDQMVILPLGDKLNTYKSCIDNIAFRMQIYVGCQLEPNIFIEGYTYL